MTLIRLFGVSPHIEALRRQVGHITFFHRRNVAPRGPSFFRGDEVSEDSIGDEARSTGTGWSQEVAALIKRPHQICHVIFYRDSIIFGDSQRFVNSIILYISSDFGTVLSHSIHLL